MDMMLEIRNLDVRYGGIHAVQGISLNIPRGSIVTLIGANGAGKSSTIRSIAGLNKTVSGEILLRRREGDAPVSLMGLKPEDMVRHGISLSPEGRRILPHLTVEENLLLGAYSRSDTDGIRADMEQVYDLFPRLRERSWQQGGTLSGGEQQMLSVGRALMSNPDMVMLDEPSLGLAPLLVKEIFDIICLIIRCQYIGFAVVTNLFIVRCKHIRLAVITNLLIIRCKYIRLAVVSYLLIIRCKYIGFAVVAYLLVIRCKYIGFTVVTNL